MVFSNLIFLYLFLPLCLAAYFLCRSIPAKNAVLIVFSLIFYAWGEPVYLFLMIAAAAVNWGFGLLIEKRHKRVFLVLALVLDLGCLAVFKYTGFVVENLKAGAMNRMGLGYEELKKVNPKLIYVAISGFGQTGPYAPRPAYDMVVQAMGGVMSITGEPGGKPVRVGASIGDIIAGIFGAFGAVTALYKRAITGEGDMVDVGMLDCQLAILENAIIKYSATGVVAGPLGAVHPTVTPFQAFETKDNYVIAACGNNRLYAAFCNALGCPELIDDPRFDTNMHRNQNLKLIGDLLTEKTRTKTTAEWLDILEKAGVPCTGINTVDKLFTDPQVAARNMLIEVDQPGMGKVKIAGNPVKMASVEADADHHPAPALGDSTRDILVNMLGWEETKADEYVEKFH